MKHTKESLEITERILLETEQKEIRVPHIISRAHLLRAVSFKSKEKYKEAYKEVSTALTFTPDNQTARKMRRELRRTLKTKEEDKKLKK